MKLRNGRGLDMNGIRHGRVGLGLDGCPDEDQGEYEVRTTKADAGHGLLKGDKDR